MLRTALTLALALSLGMPGIAGASRVIDRIVAVVNGEIITQYDLDRKLAPHIQQVAKDGLSAKDKARIVSLQRGLLQKMVDEMLLLKEAERLGIEISETEIENHIRQIKRQNNITEEQLLEQLKRERLTRDEYERNLREDMQRFRLLSAMVNRKVVVSEDDIQEYYERNREEYVRERKVSLGLILLPPEEDAGGLAQRISAGDISFEDAAVQYSIGPGKEQGGSIGNLTWSEIGLDWKAALEGVEVDGVSDPFAIGRRKAILKLIGEQAGDIRPLEEVRIEISEALRQPTYTRLYDEFMTRLKDKAIIDIRL